MYMYVSLGASLARTEQRTVGSAGNEPRLVATRRGYLVAAIVILAALLTVQVTAALTGAAEVGGAAPVKEPMEEPTTQSLPITSPYQDNPISISGGGSLCLYR